MNKRIILIPLAVYSMQAHAHIVDIYLSTGPSFSALSNDKEVLITDDVTNYYYSSEDTNIKPFAGIGLGHTFCSQDKNSWDVALSLSSYYINYDKTYGTEYPFVNGGSFDTLTYQFSAESYVAMVESRFIYHRPIWQPYLLVGLGMEWNHLYNYQEYPTNSSESASAALESFSAQTLNSFAYELGAGIQYPFFTDKAHHLTWKIALEYLYINAGRGELKPPSLQTVDNTLQVRHLQGQTAAFSLIASI